MLHQDYTSDERAELVAAALERFRAGELGEETCVAMLLRYGVNQNDARECVETAKAATTRAAGQGR